MLSESELGYVAGIIDGEGTLRTSTYTKVNGETIHYPRLAVVMTDQDVIERLQRETGLGVVYSKKTKENHHLDQWVWEVNRKNEVLELLVVVRNLVGSRRRKKMDEILGKVTALEKGEKWN